MPMSLTMDLGCSPHIEPLLHTLHTQFGYTPSLVAASAAASGAQAPTTETGASAAADATRTGISPGTRAGAHPPVTSSSTTSGGGHGMTIGSFAFHNLSGDDQGMLISESLQELGRALDLDMDAPYPHHSNVRGVHLHHDEDFDGFGGYADPALPPEAIGGILHHMGSSPPGFVNVQDLAGHVHHDDGSNDTALPFEDAHHHHHLALIVSDHTSVSGRHHDGPNGLGSLRVSKSSSAADLLSAGLDTGHDLDLHNDLGGQHGPAPPIKPDPDDLGDFKLGTSPLSSGGFKLGTSPLSANLFMNFGDAMLHDAAEALLGHDPSPPRRSHMSSPGHSPGRDEPEEEAAAQNTKGSKASGKKKGAKPGAIPVPVDEDAQSQKGSNSAPSTPSVRGKRGGRGRGRGSAGTGRATRGRGGRGTSDSDAPTGGSSSATNSPQRAKGGSRSASVSDMAVDEAEGHADEAKRRKATKNNKRGATAAMNPVASSNGGSSRPISPGGSASGSSAGSPTPSAMDGASSNNDGDGSGMGGGLSAGMDPSMKISGQYRGMSMRDAHNAMERERRVQLRENFEALRQEVPNLRDSEKAATLQILREATTFIQRLRDEERRLLEEKEQLRSVNDNLRRNARLVPASDDNKDVPPLYAPPGTG